MKHRTPNEVLLSDALRAAVESEAEALRNAVLLGDVTKAWAATTAAGRATYPYADAATFEAARAVARRVLT